MKILGALFAVALMAFLIFGLGPALNLHKPLKHTFDTSSEVQPDQLVGDRTVIAPLEISAFDLDIAYSNNEVAADRKFSHRRLKVTGQVVDISKSPMGGMRVEFERAYPILGGRSIAVIADMNPRSENDVANLHRLLSATVICSGAGEFAGFVVLDNCFVDSYKVPRPPTE